MLWPRHSNNEAIIIGSRRWWWNATCNVFFISWLRATCCCHVAIITRWWWTSKIILWSNQGTRVFEHDWRSTQLLWKMTLSIGRTSSCWWSIWRTGSVMVMTWNLLLKTSQMVVAINITVVGRRHVASNQIIRKKILHFSSMDELSIFLVKKYFHREITKSSSILLKNFPWLIKRLLRISIA